MLRVAWGRCTRTALHPLEGHQDRVIGMKKRVTLTVDEKCWRVFRLACLRKGLTASRVFEECMVDLLEEWQVDVDTETGQLSKKEGKQ